VGRQKADRRERRLMAETASTTRRLTAAVCDGAAWAGFSQTVWAVRADEELEFTNTPCRPRRALSDPISQHVSALFDTGNLHFVDLMAYSVGGLSTTAYVWFTLSVVNTHSNQKE